MTGMNFLYHLFGGNHPPSEEDESVVLSDTVHDFLDKHTRLYELIRAQTDQENGDFHLIKGCVQSGKSRIIHALCLHTTCILQTNILVIVRNFTDDYDQFRRGLENFICEYKTCTHHSDEPNIYYLGDIKRDQNNELKNHEDMVEDLVSSTNVIIALANHDQISKMNDCFEYISQHAPSFKKIHVVIDEVDQIGYSMGERLAPQLEHLLETYADRVYGVSATLFEPMQTSKMDFQSNHVYYLKPPLNYKGITDIMYHYIEPSDEDLLKDVDLMRFLDVYRNHEPYHLKHSEKHPWIGMIKTERLICQQDALLCKIKEKYPQDYTVITYNGTSCQMYSPPLQSMKIILPKCRKKGVYKKDIHTFRNTALPYVLQYLKNNGGADRFKRILIIAYKLVGRGINIVSEDFGWHLTHMFYRPSPTTDVTNLIQSMRLCGIYNDSIPLHCYIPQKDYENLYKGFMLQEELFSRLSETDNHGGLLEVVKAATVHIGKIPRCGLYRNRRYIGRTTDVPEEDKGWTLDEFFKKRCVVKMTNGKDVEKMDVKELRRLTNDTNGMFKKWANPTNQSSIARFMRDLDPMKLYTKKEIQTMCREYKVELQHLLHANVNKKTSWHYGLIMVKENDGYRIHPQIMKAFQKYF